MEKREQLLKSLITSKRLINELHLNEIRKDIDNIIEKVLNMKEYYCKGRSFEGWEEYIRLNFSYDADTGVVSRHDKKKSTGCYDSYGYLKIKIKGRTFSAHRLAWFLYYGKEPTLEIDHINGDRADNRICNLREVTRAENNYNRYHKVNSKTGYIGISPKKYKTHILYGVHYRNRNYYFDTIDEAVKFRREKGLPL